MHVSIRSIVVIISTRKVLSKRKYQWKKDHNFEFIFVRAQTPNCVHLDPGRNDESLMIK